MTTSDKIYVDCINDGINLNMTGEKK